MRRIWVKDLCSVDNSNTGRVCDDVLMLSLRLCKVVCSETDVVGSTHGAKPVLFQDSHSVEQKSPSFFAALVLQRTGGWKARSKALKTGGVHMRKLM